MSWGSIGVALKLGLNLGSGSSQGQVRIRSESALARLQAAPDDMFTLVSGHSNQCIDLGLNCNPNLHDHQRPERSLVCIRSVSNGSHSVSLRVAHTLLCAAHANW